MKTIEYTFRIQIDTEDAPNPVHLCEEIQAYLNSNVSYYDEDLDENVNAEVVGYKVQIDKLIPFIAQEEY
tara:strand:+ start:290 stop:499 length:210 start_codon:yes stop_codon:yes gene_type:complete